MKKKIKNIISLIFIIKIIICGEIIKLDISNTNEYFKTFNFIISTEGSTENINLFNITGFISLNFTHILVPDLDQFENKDLFDNETNGYNSSGINTEFKTGYIGDNEIYLENKSFSINSEFFMNQKFIFYENKSLNTNFISLKNNILDNAFDDEFNETYDYSIFGLNYIPNIKDNFPNAFYSNLKNIEKTVLINSTYDNEQKIFIGESFDNFNSEKDEIILITYYRELYKSLGWSSEIQYLIIGNLENTSESFNHSSHLIEKNTIALFNYNNYQNYHIFPKDEYFDIIKKNYFNLTFNGKLICNDEELIDENNNSYTIFKCTEKYTDLVDFGLGINGTFINFTKENLFKPENDYYLFKIYFSNYTNYVYLDINNFLEEHCSLFLHIEDVDNSFIPKVKIKGDILVDISEFSPYIKDNKMSFKGLLKLFFLGLIVFVLVVLLVTRHWIQTKGKNGEENNNNNENNLIEH